MPRLSRWPFPIGKAASTILPVDDFSAVSCGIVRYRAVSCGIVRYRAVSCGIVRYRAVSCGIVRYVVWYIGLETSSNCMNEPTEAPLNSVSRLPAILAGALMPLALGVAAIVALLAVGSQSSAPFKEAGTGGVAVWVLPGVIVIGSVFAFPTSALLVFVMTKMMRRTSKANHVLTWTIAGPFFSLPVSLIFWSFDPPRAIPIGLLVGLSLGLIGGFSAGIKRPYLQPSGRID